MLAMLIVYQAPSEKMGSILGHRLREVLAHFLASSSAVQEGSGGSNGSPVPAAAALIASSSVLALRRFSRRWALYFSFFLA
jgi:hypothetical protein